MTGPGNHFFVMTNFDNDPFFPAWEVMDFGYIETPLMN